MVRTIIGGVCVGVWALSITAEAAAPAWPAGAGVTAAALPLRPALASAPTAGLGQVRQAPRKPTIGGAADARRAWLGAEHRGLTVQKTSNRVDGSLTIDLRYGQDFVSIGIDVTGAVAVSRHGRQIRVATAEELAQVQRVLSGSEAAVATRFLLAEREAVSDLNAGEMSLLSAAAFVASLLGDIDAPRRLAARFAAKQGGIRPVRMQNCYDTYASEVSASWNDMQACMDEANQDSSILNRAYRRVACNGVWLLRSESAWIEYLGCLGPGQIFQ